jgi:hypothetical protein
MKTIVYCTGSTHPRKLIRVRYKTLRIHITNSNDQNLTNITIYEFPDKEFIDLPMNGRDIEEEVEGWAVGCLAAEHRLYRVDRHA